jgi:hypothetical protein
MNSRFTPRRLALSAVLAAIPALAACSASPPTAEIRSARDAVARAEYDGAAQLAPAPLQQAHTKLATAQTSVSNKEMDRARNFAEEAQADADYADAVSVVQKSGQTSQQMQLMQRRPGSATPAQ